MSPGLADGDDGLGQPEVEKLGAGPSEHDVAGLQIAVDDAGAMRGLECRGDLTGVAQRLRERERSGGEPRGERVPVQQLHHDVVGAAVDADVVDRADVRVVEGGDRARLAGEAIAGGGRRSAGRP